MYDYCHTKVFLWWLQIDGIDEGKYKNEKGTC